MDNSQKDTICANSGTCSKVPIHKHLLAYLITKLKLLAEQEGLANGPEITVRPKHVNDDWKILLVLEIVGRGCISLHVYSIVVFL